jgi:hypothetical protein
VAPGPAPGPAPALPTAAEQAGPPGAAGLPVQWSWCSDLMYIRRSMLLMAYPSCCSRCCSRCLTGPPAGACVLATLCGCGLPAPVQLLPRGWQDLMGSRLPSLQRHCCAAQPAQQQPLLHVPRSFDGGSVWMGWGKGGVGGWQVHSPAASRWPTAARQAGLREHAWSAAGSSC